MLWHARLRLNPRVRRRANAARICVCGSVPDKTNLCSYWFVSQQQRSVRSISTAHAGGLLQWKCVNVSNAFSYMNICVTQNLHPLKSNHKWLNIASFYSTGHWKAVHFLMHYIMCKHGLKMWGKIWKFGLLSMYFHFWPKKHLHCFHFCYMRPK